MPQVKVPRDSSEAMPPQAANGVAMAPPRGPHTTGLPAPLKAGIEGLSGVAMDDVRVHHDSPRPARLQALAYAQGSDIHLGPAQDQHLAHEAWHVVQQKQGRVQATRQMMGAAVNADAGLEREADVMGARALRWTGPRAEQGPAGSTGEVVQCFGAPVIQAKLMPLHNNARRPVLRGDRYLQQDLEDGHGKRWFVDLEPEDYPHLSQRALGAYEASVTKDPDKGLDAASIYEDIVEPCRAYKFKETESVALHSIHISAGDQIITMAPRSPNPLSSASAAAQERLNATGHGGMGEEDLQHVSTHYPETPHGGTHKHFVARADEIDVNVVSKMIDVLEDRGIIGQPKVNGSNVPVRVKKVDGMDDSYEVGARVREALGVPPRSAERVDVKKQYEEQQAAKAKAKAKPKAPAKAPAKAPSSES